MKNTAAVRMESFAGYSEVKRVKKVSFFQKLKNWFNGMIELETQIKAANTVSKPLMNNRSGNFYHDINRVF
jgi:hypothetical protein